jgi:sec-independent protein translocase protein TatA
VGSLSIWHILILATIVLVLFGGRGKVSDLMGDVGKGIKSFRAGLNDPEQVSPAVTATSHRTSAARGPYRDAIDDGRRGQR